MRLPSRFHAAVTLLLACLGPLRSAGAAPPPLQDCFRSAPEASRIVDVALGPQGTFQGVLVDAQGTAMSGAEVLLLRGAAPAETAETDPQGRFAFCGLHGGVYGVVAGGTVQVCRLWAPGTAPPAAIPGLLIAAGGQLVRHSPSYDWVSERPLLTYTLITAAIVVPVTLIAEACDDGPKS